MDEKTTKAVISLSNIHIITQSMEEKMAQVDSSKMEDVEWDLMTATWFLIRRELETVINELEKE